MTNWPEYNNRLVNEVVDVFVSKDLLVDQKKQLQRVNKDKLGRPYVYSNALMLIILSVKEYLGLPYRQTKVLPGCSAEYGEPDALYTDMQETEGTQHTSWNKVR